MINEGQRGQRRRPRIIHTKRRRSSMWLSALVGPSQLLKLFRWTCARGRVCESSTTAEPAPRHRLLSAFLLWDDVVYPLALREILPRMYIYRHRGKPLPACGPPRVYRAFIFGSRRFEFINKKTHTPEQRLSYTAYSHIIYTESTYGYRV
ncbi:unnamed protein product [Trichogramma brassicae]|uniref:Uncharacterized protein n=1 Tax=Trichogramma brassicae TaxID=86971 RepID=A0A6H5I3H4_9HYME|nr:unnamed protein product [Trichogramma brassicae]